MNKRSMSYDEARLVVRYRLMGYSPTRIAELFHRPLPMIELILRDHRLIGDGT